MSTGSLKTEFLLRIEASQVRGRPRRRTSARGQLPLALEEHTRLLRLGPASVTLTPAGCRLFRLLASREGTIVPRAVLQPTCARSSHGTNTPDVYVLDLRRKLAILGSSCTIRTVRGVGYGLINLEMEWAFTEATSRPTRWALKFGGIDS